jgi:DNA-binding transcriptional LysR family regulator
MPLADLRLADVMTFLAVQRCGSITGAARELKVSASQVSKAVARLEEQLGLNLLARSTRGVHVSEPGRRVVPELEEVVARLSGIGRVDRAAEHELTIAAPSYLTALFLPRIATARPSLRVRGLELPPPLVRAYAAENFFDLALTLGRERLPTAWESTHVGEVKKALFAAPEVAARLGPGPLAVEQLREQPFISPIYSVDGRFLPVDDGCPIGYGERKLGHEVTTIGTALELAAASGHLVFGPLIAARALLDSRRLVELPVRGWAVADSLFIACNTERVRAPDQKAIVATITSGLVELGRA